MKLNPYLHFDGQCEAAFKYYEQCLGGTIEAMMPYGGSPMEGYVGPDAANRIMHATMMIGDNVLMGADLPPAQPGEFAAAQGFSIALHFKDTAEAERVFNDLALHGKVRVELQETFWAARFGEVIDQFGTPWMINCEQAVK